MSLLEITGLTHSFGDHFLFKDAGLELNKGEHIGVVGQNGVGKSTLIKICTGQIIPDSGLIKRNPKVTMGYLDQYAQIQDMTMNGFLRTAFADLYEAEAKMNALYEQAASGDMDCLAMAAKYQEKLELNNFYITDTKIERVAAGLGLTAIGLECPVRQMSGGQRAKVILAKLLLEKPDILLLDEPTNFLDKEHIAWLADYLVQLPNAFFVISHDYAFLEKIVTGICDIDNEKITKYYGSYVAFTKKKAALREDYIRHYVAQQREIKKTEAFIQKNIAGRKSKMARGRQKQLDRMTKLEGLEQKENKPDFQFKATPTVGSEHLTVKHLSVGYHYPLLRDIHFSVKGGEKIVVTGFNGIGKSTLLKTLIGQITPLKGKFSFADQVVCGYFQQDLVWADVTANPVEIIAGIYQVLTVKEVRKHLARCGISQKQAMQTVGTLSGGEQAKVKMCILTLAPCNFLIMDEPTNHLDKQAKESLKTALSQFSGTVLLVSHEEAFYRDWAQKIINLKELNKHHLD